MRTDIAPQILYKYQSVSDNSRKNFSFKNLSDQTLRFSKPESFNDPFDCNINFTLVDDDKEENLQGLFARLLALETDKKAYQTKYTDNGKVNEKFKNNIPEMAKRATKSILARSQWKVFCLSEDNENILMWSHYASKHQGFCLEFDTSCAPFKPVKTQILLKVNYSEKYPPLSVNDIPYNLPSIPQFMFGTKSLHWSYEKEWRMFIEREDQNYPFDPLALVGVYLGCKMKESDKQEIAKILVNFPNAKLYQMRSSESEFKLLPQKLF